MERYPGGMSISFSDKQLVDLERACEQVYGRTISEAELQDIAARLLALYEELKRLPP